MARSNFHQLWDAAICDIPEDDKVKIMSDLEEYCGRDTEGMIWIVERLKELTR